MDFERFASPNWLSTTLSASSRSRKPPTNFIDEAFKAIERVCGDYNSYRAWVENIKATPEEAVAELNARFLEHGIGYRYESQEIIRVDSEFLHAEAVKPALVLLRDKDYQGANE